MVNAFSEVMIREFVRVPSEAADAEPAKEIPAIFF